MLLRSPPLSILFLCCALAPLSGAVVTHGPTRFVAHVPYETDSEPHGPSSAARLASLVSSERSSVGGRGTMVQSQPGEEMSTHRLHTLGGARGSEPMGESSNHHRVSPRRFLPCGCGQVAVLHRTCEAAVDTFRSLVDRQVYKRADQAAGGTRVVLASPKEPWETVARDLAAALQRDGPSMGEFIKGTARVAQREAGSSGSWGFRACARSKAEQLVASLGVQYFAEAVLHIALRRQHDPSWSKRHDSLVCTEFLRSESPSARKGVSVLRGAVNECHARERHLRAIRDHTSHTSH